MKNFKISKLFFAVFFTFLVFSGTPALFAKDDKAKSVEQKPDEMRIFVKEGEEILTHFTTNFLSFAPKVNVVLPTDFGAIPAKHYPSIYIISDKSFGKAEIATLFPEYFGQYIFVTVTAGDMEKDLIKFITLELLPFVETNYAAAPEAFSRILVVKNFAAIQVLQDLSVVSRYLSNIALLFSYSTSMPDIKGDIPKTLNLWVQGPLDNIANINYTLDGFGLKYLDNFAYKIGTNPQINFGDVNFDYLLKPASRKIKKRTIFQQYTEMGVKQESTSLFWLKLTTKGGYLLDFIPKDFKIAPPFLNWNFKTAKFNVIYGAPVGKVTAYGALPFGGKFSATFKLVE